MSRTQIYQLTKIFKWRKEKIRLTKSNRFKIKNRKKYLNKFILPYNISNKSKLLNQIDYLLQILPDRIFIKPSILPLASISILITSLENDSFESPTITL